MKKKVIVSLLLVTVFPLVAQASCDSVKAEISQKITGNGVAESAFSLDVVPNDQADQAGGQVVGHCENDTQKIIYRKIASDTSAVPAESTDSGQDTSPQQ